MKKEIDQSANEIRWCSFNSAKHFVSLNGYDAQMRINETTSAFGIRIIFMMIFVLLCVISSHAQDTIIKRNDEKIIAKIAEVNPDNIKYKRFDNQDGPIYTLQKSEIKNIVYANGVKESYENYQPPLEEKKDVPLKTDLTFQPSGKYYIYKNNKIAEQDMLDIAWKLKDKKTCLLVKKTEESKAVKNGFLYGGIVVGAAGLLTFTGVINAFNSRAAMSTTGGSRSSRHAAYIAARNGRMQTGGYLLLGGLACEIVSVSFKFRETREAHMVVELYNNAITAK